MKRLFSWANAHNPNADNDHLVSMEHKHTCTDLLQRYVTLISATKRLVAMIGNNEPFHIVQAQATYVQSLLTKGMTDV